MISTRNHIVNVDRNIPFNINELNSFFVLQDPSSERVAKIIKALLIYFSFSYKEDLFGYGCLDPYTFASVMKLNKDSLFEVYPGFSSDTSGNRKDIFKTYLERALYLLVSKPILDSYKVYENKGHSYIVRNYIVLKEVKIEIKKMPSGQEKFYYRYSLDEAFERNLRKFFLKTSLSAYIGCKSHDLEDFYLYIKNIFFSQKKTGSTMYYFKFPELVTLLHISPALSPKHQKMKINSRFRTLEKFFLRI